MNAHEQCIDIVCRVYRSPIDHYSSTFKNTCCIFILVGIPPLLGHKVMNITKAIELFESYIAVGWL